MFETRAMMNEREELEEQERLNYLLSSVITPEEYEKELIRLHRDFDRETPPANKEREEDALTVYHLIRTPEYFEIDDYSDNCVYVQPSWRTEQSNKSRGRPPRRR
jgi:hypothetical protein